MTETTRTALIVLSGLALLAGAPPAFGQGTNEPGEIPGAARRAIEQVEEVTVTARKRVERLEDTPVSVTALGDTALRDANVQRLNEVDKLVPNLQFFTFRTGQEAQVFIRGVGQLDQLITTDPGVGIYVDGVYLSRSAGSVLRLLDVDRVEVLRGPQGTLFGKNTAGGAINVITVKPQETLEGLASVRTGNLGTVDTRFTLNVPVSVGALKDKLFSRFTVISANRDGYTENTFRKEEWSDTHALGTLGSLRFVPTDDIELNLSGTWFRDHSRGKGGQCIFVQPAPSSVARAALPAGFEDACKATEPFKFQADTWSLSDIETYGTWGTITWNGGDAGPVKDLSVKSITSWRQQVPRIREDIDMTEFTVAFQSAVGGGGPFDGEPGSAQQISQELQVNGRALDGRLTVVGGAYGFWEDARTQQVIRTLPDIDPIAQIAGGPTTLNDIKVDNWSYAVYNQNTLDIIEKSLSLTAGFRWTIERKQFSKFSLNPFAPEGNPNRIPIDADEGETFNAWTPMASLAYRFPKAVLTSTPIDHLMLYFTYSQGFKSGGFNGGARLGRTRGQLEPYDPEFVNAYELGLKTIAFDKRASLNLALFMSDYSDIQVISTRPDPRLPLVADRIVQNAAEASIMGLETEVEVRPFTGMNLLGSLGLLDTEYDKFPDGIDNITGQQRDRTGERFNFVSDFKSNLIAQYTTPVDAPGPKWLSGWVTPRIEYYYQGRVNHAGPELQQARQSGYGLLAARFSYDFNDDATQIALWAQNLTDEEYFGFVFPATTNTIGHMIRYYEPPRTFGAEVSYRF